MKCNMKKKIIFIVLSLCFSLCLQGQSYKEIFRKVNTTNFNIGIHYGRCGWTKELSLNELIVSATFCGVYIDCGGWPRKHGSDTRIGYWNGDKKCTTFHIGYQIPIQECFRITPLIGYAYIAEGTTDGHHWSYNSHHGIVNSFIPTYTFKSFDYGVQITFNINHINIHSTITKNNWCIGLGWEVY